MVKKNEGIGTASAATSDIPQLRKQILNHEWFQCMEESVSSKYKRIKRSRREQLKNIHPSQQLSLFSTSSSQQFPLIPAQLKWKDDEIRNQLQFLNSQPLIQKQFMLQQQQQQFQQLKSTKVQLSKTANDKMFPILQQKLPNMSKSKSKEERFEDDYNEEEDFDDEYYDDDEDYSSEEEQQKQEEDILDRPEYMNFQYTYSYTQQDRKKEITVKLYDLKKLSPNQYLNDTIVNFFLKFYEVEILSKEMQEKVLIFNTYFMSKLAPNEQIEALISSDVEVMTPIFEKNYQTVRRWIKEDIFEKDFLVFPLNLPEHWSVVIVCNHKALLEKKSSKQKKEFEPERKEQPVVDSNLKEEKEEKDQEKGEQAEMELEEKKQDDKMEIEEPQQQEQPKEQQQTQQPAEVKKQGIEMNKPATEINNNPCIIYFDSFGLLDKKYSTMIRLYLQKEYTSKKQSQQQQAQPADQQQLIFNETNLPAIQPLIPRQTNYVDCGLYLLEYVENFLNSTPLQRSAFTSNDSSYWVQLRWFPRCNIKQKRKHIKELVLDLSTQSIQESVINYLFKRSQLQQDYQHHTSQYDIIDVPDFIDHLQLIQEETMPHPNLCEDSNNTNNKSNINGIDNTIVSNSNTKSNNMNDEDRHRILLDFYMNPNYNKYEVL